MEPMNGLLARRGSRVMPAIVLSILVLAGRAGAGDPCSCPGDCDADCVTSAADLRRTVSAIFDSTAFEGCPVADADGDGRVTAADLVRVALSIVNPSGGCSGAPTPTVSPSSTQGRTSTATPSRTPTPTPTGAGTPASQWIDRAPLPGGGRQEVGAALLDGRIYVIGGFTEQNSGSARADAYDVAKDEWTQVANLPSARNHIGAGAAAGRVYAIGGFTGSSFNPTADVFRYDPQKDEWTPAAPLPSARGALAVVEVDGMLYAIGGSGPTGSVGDTAVYDPGTNTWTALASLPTPRNHLAAAVIDGRIYAVGGRDAGNIPALNRYDPDTGQWETLAPLPTRRSGLGAGVLNGRLVVFGGEGAPCNFQGRGVCAEIELYDPATNSWTSLDPMPVPRHGIWAVSTPDRIYVPGGAEIGGFDATAHHDALRIE